MTSITRSPSSAAPTIAAFTTTGGGTSSPMSRAIASPSMQYGGESTVRPSTSRYHATAALPGLRAVQLMLDRGGRLVGRGEHVGLDRPGHDLEHPDPELANLGLQRLADRAHRRLARTVGPEERDGREHRRRRDVADHA